MNRSVIVLLGAVLTATGATFMLQGLNVLKGSAMSDETVFIFVGLIVAIVGVMMLVYGFRRPGRTP